MTSLTYDLFYGYQDTLTIEVPIDTGKRDIPIEFYMCRRKDWKKKSNELSHLTDMVSIASAKNYKLNET